MFEGLFRPSHLLVILVLCIIIFGPKKLPELGKALGDGIRGLKDGLSPAAPAKTDATDTKAKSDSTPAK